MSKNPKTLAMIKMEKNFVAVNEKKYPRRPYEDFTVFKILDWLSEEFVELCDAIKKKDIEAAKLECADVSNLTDFLFERLGNNPEEMK